MKYITYFIFAAFVIALFLFLRSALEPERKPLEITGSEKCGECHILELNGNQNKIWNDSKHSKAYQTLLSEQSLNFTRINNLEEPDKNTLCLKCHTTKYFIKRETQLYYNINEGVGCEACHGAGSLYSPDEMMKDEALFEKNGGEKGNERDCRKCHSLKGSDEMILNEDRCPFQKNDFKYAAEWEKIKHPVNKNNFK